MEQGSKHFKCPEHLSVLLFSHGDYQLLVKPKNPRILHGFNSAQRATIFSHSDDLVCVQLFE